MSSNKKLLQGASGFINQSGGLNVEDVFSCDLAVGVPGGSVTINNGIDLSSEGGLVWTKNREITSSHYLVDTVRGAGKGLYSNTNDAEANVTDGPTSFSSNGFSTGSSPANSHIYWTFRKAENFFDIVTYTGSGENGQTINHNLGVVPGMVIVKDTDASSSWYVYHRDLASGKHLKLNSNNEESSDTNYEIGKDTATATQFSIDTGSEVDANGNTYVAYFFAHHNSSGTFGSGGDEDIIKCGTFTTDSSGNYDGSTALGFEPQWIMYKGASTSGHWFIHDSLRGISDITMNYVLANSSNAESEFNADRLKLTPDGFVFDGNHLEANDTYIYMAIRKGPMATPTTRSSVFALLKETTGTLNDSPKFKQVSNFPVDYVINKIFDATTDWWSAARITNSRLQLNDTAAETSVASTHEFDHSDGVAVSGLYGASDFTSYMFRRAPGFFDVVTYDGDGGVSTVQYHNLTVDPEMIWYKARSEIGHWGFYHKDLVSTQRQVYLNLDLAGTQSYGSFIAPTTTQFAVGGNACAGGTNNTNKSGEKYVAFLFATLSGISKVGSFSHTNGSSTDVDCGFSSGSALVIVKRTDATGDWFVWDSARGIVAGDDPYMLFTSTAAEVTNTDFIDPLNSGFQIASGFTTGDYIFYAIAS